MKKPDTPHDEEERLKTLYSLDVLDTGAEERFDRLTRLAKRMFDVPIALVSLVDANRQWFKSHSGLEATETTREVSFCGHAILSDDIFMVSDATQDERFFDNPLVTNDPYVCFYAGYTLKHLNGSKLGTLCIIDSKPRILNKDDIEALRDLAELAERELAAVQLATIDDLTLISNRRGFTLLAQKSLNLCARQNIPVTLVYFDLNNFKSINDTFGHAEGDRALITFAEKMKYIFRDSDVIARMGGDEFVVLLTNTVSEHAEKIISRLRQSIENYNKEENSGYDISFSDGIVTVDNAQEHTIQMLLDQSDALMYEKKYKHFGTGEK